MTAPFTLHRHVGCVRITDPLVVRRTRGRVVDAHRHMEDGEPVGTIVLTV